jgi:hypothetical protein
MAKYFTAFNDSPSLTERWDTAAGSYTIESSGLPSGSTGGYALKIVMALGDGRYAVQWNTPGSPSDDDVEILIRWQVDATDSRGGSGRAIILGGGGSGTEDGYFTDHIVSGSSAAQKLGKYDNGSSNTLDSHNESLSANTYYWTRLGRVDSSDTMHHKTWSGAIGDEPGSWETSDVDTAHTSGWFGVGQFSGNQDLWIDLIGVGTEGDTAPDSLDQTLTAASGDFSPDFNNADLIYDQYLTASSFAFQDGYNNATLIYDQFLAASSFQIPWTGNNATVSREVLIGGSVWGAVRRISQFSLAISDPIGTDYEGVQVYPVDTRITSMSMATKLPGGFDRLNVGIMPSGTVDRRSVLTRPIQAKPLSHVQVYAGQRLVYEGRLSRRVRVGGGGIVGLTAQGYGTWGLTDRFYPNDTDVECLTDNALRDAVAQVDAVKMIWCDAPTIRRYYADFGRMTIDQIVNKIISDGSPAGDYDFYIYENRDAFFLPRDVPSFPDYAIPFDNTVIWEDDYTSYYSGAAITYSDEDGIERISPVTYRPDVESEIGITRTALLNASDGDTPTSAQGYRDSYLEFNARNFTAARIERKDFSGLNVYGGGEVAGYFVRSGQWVQVGDEEPQIVVRTSFDFKSGNSSYDLVGTLKHDFRTALNTTIEDARTLKRGISPETKARTRRNWKRRDWRDFSKRSHRSATRDIWNWLQENEPDGWTRR